MHILIAPRKGAEDHRQPTPLVYIWDRVASAPYGRFRDGLDRRVRALTVIWPLGSLAVQTRVREVMERNEQTNQRDCAGNNGE